MNLPALQPGSGIGLIAPAGPVKEEKILPGVRLLEEAGFRVKFASHLFGKFRFFSGTMEQRLEDVHNFLADPEVAALYAVRGGVGSSQLLPGLDFSLWKKQWKLLIGFSDITALQWALWQKTGLPSISGMTLTSQLRAENPFAVPFFEILRGERYAYTEKDFPAGDFTVFREGRAKGVLVGGTLSIITSLLGTPFFPRFSNIILFLEDINEPVYRIERMLVQLKLAGVLDRVTGLILGRFTLGNRFPDFWQEVEYLFPPAIPVIGNFPYGHFTQSCALPCGVSAELHTSPFLLKW